MTTTNRTVVHLVSGEREEVDGTPAEVADHLVAGNDLVRFGDTFVNPAHVTHLTVAVSRDTGLA
ncbi:MAG TPA: hypothetical protein VG165_10100 [Solirubrobacteraceae bacterium]|jgi:hypothetical protein|nr:hypothetical protein [Solirubrobacteraceae bacterium]